VAQLRQVRPPGLVAQHQLQGGAGLQPQGLEVAGGLGVQGHEGVLGGGQRRQEEAGQAHGDMMKDSVVLR
jgi:hypothetical protein